MEEKKIKVVHLITLLEFGGAQGNTLYTVHHLDQNRYKTYLWAGKGAYWDNIAIQNLSVGGRIKFFKSLVRSINPICDVIVTIQLYLSLRKLKPSIIHTHSSKAGILGRIAAWLARTPVIIHTFHGFGFNDQQKPWTRFLFILLEKVTAPMADKLIFVSESNMEVAKKNGIGHESQYKLIRSGIPITEIRMRAERINKTQFKREIGITKEALVVTTIGAFKPQKNLLDFIEVASSVISKTRPVHFVVVGDGEQRRKIEQKIEKKNLEKRIHLLGWREDVPEILSISDIFVLTSLWEGLPRALVEALVLFKPVVCYDTDGVRDLLKLGGGIVVPLKDTGELTRKINNLLLNIDTKIDFPDTLTKKIDSEFDISHMVTQQDKLYQHHLNTPT